VKTLGRLNTQRALDLLDRAAANVLKLGEQVTLNPGLLGVLREQVESLRRKLKAQRRSSKLEKHRLRQTADKLFVATVEYLNEIISSLADEGRTPS
jgi:hypothetical protein